MILQTEDHFNQVSHQLAHKLELSNTMLAVCTHAMEPQHVTRPNMPHTSNLAIT